jgi:uncharacterized membrane protein
VTPAGKGYERGEQEFSRVVNFSDGVFAIAMTLVVVGIQVPDVATDDLPSALGDQLPQIIAFFAAFLFIGRYWLAHHQFFGQLRSVDTRQIAYSLVYLAAIAFLPFPIALVGRYEHAPLAVVITAATFGTASFLESVMFARARNTGALNRPISNEAYRYFQTASMIPVVLFVVSIPIAFVHTTLALCSWLLTYPIEMVLGRRRPPGVDEYLLK